METKAKFNVILSSEASDFLEGLNSKIREKIIYNIRKSTYTIDPELFKKLDDTDTYGVILRAKGMLPSNDGTWINFDYVPEESNVRTGAPEVTGKICVIGSKLNEDNLKALFTK